MKPKDVFKIIVIFGLAGVLFSGYLTYYTIFSHKPGCEVFIFGLPSCFYGALMYLIVFILSLYLIRTSKSKSKIPATLAIVSLIGVLFASFLTWYVLTQLSCTSLEILGIPPCVYGLVMYLIVLILAIIGAYRKGK